MPMGTYLCLNCLLQAFIDISLIRANVVTGPILGSLLLLQDMSQPQRSGDFEIQDLLLTTPGGTTQNDHREGETHTCMQRKREGESQRQRERQRKEEVGLKFCLNSCFG